MLQEDLSRIRPPPVLQNSHPGAETLNQAGHARSAPLTGIEAKTGQTCPVVSAFGGANLLIINKTKSDEPDTFVRFFKGSPGNHACGLALPAFQQCPTELHTFTISLPLQSPPALFPLRSTCLARRARDSAVDDRAPVAGARPRWAPDCPAPVSRPE